MRGNKGWTRKRPPKGPISAFQAGYSLEMGASVV